MTKLANRVEATIEIPKGSQIKYEYNRETKEIAVDRILFGAMAYPQNYGFIKDALDWDGDELDILVLANQSFQPGVVVPTRIIGALEMIDGREVDTKLIGVIDVDHRYANIQKLEDVSKGTLEEIRDFFENYKNLQNKKVILKGFKDLEWALNEYRECQEVMKKYGSLTKEKFLIEMRKIHPEKYL